LASARCWKPGTWSVEQLLDLVGDAILVYDRVGLIWASDALERVSARARVVGTMFALGDPEDIAAASTTTCRRRRAGPTVSRTATAVTTPRAGRAVDSTTRFSVEQTDRDYAVVLLHDVTELAEAENSLPPSPSLRRRARGGARH
jgi:hypothetical protein